MGIGGSIFLLALGAILAFAVDWRVSGLDLHMVGWILMVVGAGGLILFFSFWNRRRAPRTFAVVRQPRVAEVVSTYDDPMPPPPLEPR
jgi:Domain of unknown function (DUF6458)